jgi:hypothetical protein
MYLGGQALGTGRPWQHLQYWKKKKKKRGRGEETYRNRERMKDKNEIVKLR